MQSYVVRSKVDKSGEEQKTQYYGVPVLSGQITDKELAVTVQEQTALSEGDFLSALSTLKRLMRTHFLHGRSVRIEGIGTFYVSAGSEGSDTPEGCTPSKLKAQRICFTADKDLRSVLPDIKYEKINRPRKKR